MNRVSDRVPNPAPEVFGEFLPVARSDDAAVRMKSEIPRGKLNRRRGRLFPFARPEAGGTAAQTAFYLLHAWRDRVDFPDLKRKIIELANAWNATPC